MANYQEVRVKLTYRQLNTLKSTAKIKTEIILKINKKNFEAQIFEIIQLCGSFGSWLGILGKKVITHLPVPLSRDN